MQSIRTALLAGVAALGLAGLTGQAVARTPQIHVLTVHLPDGGTEQIRYVGDVAPRVVFVPDATREIAFEPADALFGDASPFALLERISARMDALMNQVAPGPDGLTEAMAGSLPAGATSFTMVSSMTGSGICTRMTRVVAGTDGAKPQVVSQTSGNCGAAFPASVPAAVQAPVTARQDRPRTIDVRATDNYRALVRPASAWQRG